MRGFTIVELLIALAITALVALVAIPDLIESRRHGNEAAAIGALKSINSAQTLHREGSRYAVLLYGDLRALGRAGLIDDELAAGVKKGYVFVAEPSTSTPELLWWATATPVAPGLTGERSFATNHAGVIYYTYGLGRATVTVPRDTCAMGLHLLPGCK